MTKLRIPQKLRLPKVLILLGIIFSLCTLLVFINYSTIKILSANRAYASGESQYSKGQKDAVRHLTNYLYSKDDTQWELYKAELKVPQATGAARRIGLINNSDLETIKKNLIAGRNNEKDLDNVIWVFKNLKSVSFFKKALKEWEESDVLINQIYIIGNNIHHAVKTQKLNDELRQNFLSQIDDVSEKSTISQQNFSNTLGESTRQIRDYLIYTNIIFILIIICSICAYFFVMIKKLSGSKFEIEIKNKELTKANKELDKFVYSASHDLRSPITSLKGLIEVVKLEDDPKEFDGYLNLMQLVLSKQEQFISDIVDYSRHKHTKAITEPISLNEIIDDVITQHRYISEVQSIDIKKELLTDQINSDRLRLKIILNNLISNAIKYADLKKEKPFISIKTYSLKESCILEIEDNGIGIREEFQDQIFDMFFVTNSNKGTGLGLYIVKEAIENINGDITVDSEINIGTKFTVTIPNQD